MENILKKIGKISSFASRYIGIIIIAFSCLAFFWRDGFAWMTNYTSVFLGVIMFGMGLTIRLEDFRAIFSRPKEVIIGAVAQYTIMPNLALELEFGAGAGRKAQHHHESDSETYELLHKFYLLLFPKPVFVSGSSYVYTGFLTPDTKCSAQRDTFSN